MKEIHLDKNKVDHLEIQEKFNELVGTRKTIEILSATTGIIEEDLWDKILETFPEVNKESERWKIVREHGKGIYLKRMSIGKQKGDKNDS